MKTTIFGWHVIGVLLDEILSLVKESGPVEITHLQMLVLIDHAIFQVEPSVNNLLFLVNLFDETDYLSSVEFGQL